MRAVAVTKFWLAAALLAASLGACAQVQKAEEFKPQVGQAGKDVIWVPTPEEVVERMLKMANAGPNDFVVDLGSGDGRIAIAAAKKFGARAMGVEFNPSMVTLSRREAQKQGVANRVQFVNADIFQTDFSKATIITMYLLPDLNLKLRPRILDMKPGTRVASHQFNMGDWEPDEAAVVDGRNAYLWIVPAKVAGAWHVQAGGQAWDLTLTQSFQKIAGVAKAGERGADLRDLKLKGDQISFVIEESARHEFSGRVNGNAMEGAVRGGGAESRWSAVRK